MDPTNIPISNPTGIYASLATDSNSQIIFTVGLLVFWSALYTVVNYSCHLKTLSERDANDTKNRIVSIVHGVVSFWCATAQYLPYPIFKYSSLNLSQNNTNFQTFICLFSLSYCIYDLLACIYYRLSDISLISHHLFCILGFGFAAWCGFGAIDAIGGLFVAEVSNFFMHLRVIVRTYDRKNTKAYEYSENVYLGMHFVNSLVLYIIFRGFICPIVVWYSCITSSNSPLVVKLMCTSLTVQSFYFILQMAGIIKKKLIRYKEMKAKKVEFMWLEENSEQLQKLSFYKKKETINIF